MTLFDLCRPHATLSIVGTAKNVGKTTCLNHLIDRYEAQGVRMGLTSVGRDGEDIDVVTDRPKPRITPPPGTLVATAATSAKRSQARLREVAKTPFRTAIGPVGIYEVLGPGQVEVAGPVTVQDTVALVRILRQHGARQVFVDGAIDRRASASGAVADGVVLATGLSLSDDPAEVVAHTVAQTRFLSLEAAPYAGLPEETGVLTLAGDFLPWQGSTVLEQGEELVRWMPEDARCLVLQGALTEGVAKQLLKREQKELDVVVPDGTHLLVQPETFDRLLGRGVRFHAARPIRLVAVTVNPTSPFGAAVEPDSFLAMMRERLNPIPVLDVVHNQGRLST